MERTEHGIDRSEGSGDAARLDVLKRARESPSNDGLAVFVDEAIRVAPFETKLPCSRRTVRTDVSPSAVLYITVERFSDELVLGPVFLFGQTLNFMQYRGRQGRGESLCGSHTDSYQQIRRLLSNAVLDSPRCRGTIELININQSRSRRDFP